MKIWFQWTANGMLIGSQSNAYWHPIKCQLTTNLKTINTKLKANWQPIECQSTTNLNQINNQSDTNRKPNWCKLKTNRMPIDIQSNANAELLPYRQAGVSSFCLSNPMPMQNCCHRERQGYRVYAYQIHYTLANWCLSECQSTTNLMLINSQSNANRLPIWCQFTTNLMPINNKSDTN